MSDSHVHRLRIVDVIRRTHDAHSLVFELAPNQRTSFAYRPGQFLTLRIPSDLGPVARCYSLSSSPFTDDTIEVTVKRTRDGYASNWLCDNAVPGLEVDVLEPAGVFCPHSFDGKFLLIAGGSGVTPVMSILKSVISEGSGSAVVIYANRDQESVIFKDELNTLEAEHPDRVTVIHRLDSVQGVPSTATLAALLRQLDFDQVFMCGPKPFMDGHRQALKALDFPRANVHIERFSSLGGDPFEAMTVAPAADHHVARMSPVSVEQSTGTAPAVSGSPVTEPPGSGSPSPESPSPESPSPESPSPESPMPGTTAGSASARSMDSTVHVELDGENHTFDWPAEVRLLDLLKARGLRAPSSCSEGVCAACECRLVEGKVEMVNNQVLEQEDIEDGYILACQSLPISEVVRITYEDQ